MDLYTIGDDNATVTELIAVLNLGLSIAEEAEVMSPENISAVRAWIKAERFRLRDEPTRPTRPLDNLRSSKYYGFWSTLEADQEVRWNKTKAATYFVVDANSARTPPRYCRGEGPWIELRRHTGKTFWAHIATIRPLIPEEPGWRELTDAEEAAEERTWD